MLALTARRTGRSIGSERDSSAGGTQEGLQCGDQLVRRTPPLEVVARRQHDQLSIGDPSRQEPAVRDGHHPVVSPADDQGGGLDRP